MKKLIKRMLVADALILDKSLCMLTYDLEISDKHSFSDPWLGKQTGKVLDIRPELNPLLESRFKRRRYVRLP